jgi:signal transduction histidine kinase/CheY-like chemotaxis protein/ligand-binding sensor domain-containing protein
MTIRALGHSLIVFLLAIMVCPAEAQRYAFKFYDQQNGLQNLGVASLLQDHEGFVWAATEGGLFRYDGRFFEQVETDVDSGGSDIRSLLETSDGTLWIATRHALLRRRFGHIERIQLGKEIELWEHNSLASDGLNVYLASPSGLALIEVNAQGNYQVHWISELSSSGIAVDGSKTVWFGCQNSLCRWDGRSVENVDSRYGLPSGRWSSIATDSGGNLWLRSADQLLELPRGSDRFVNRSQGVNSAVGPLPAITSTPQGELLVPTCKGLAIVSDRHRELVDAAHGLSTSCIGSVLYDREGSVWLGLVGVGIARWLGYQRWERWTRAEGLSDPDIIWAIRRDRHGTLWAGSTSGLNRWDASTGKWHTLHVNNGLKGENIKAIAADPTDGLWVGASPGGVSYLNAAGRVVASYDASNGLPGHILWGILVDQQHRVWVGTADGLFHSMQSLEGGTADTKLLRNLRFEKVKLPLTDSRGSFYQPFLDSRRWLWFPSSQGLWCLRGDQWSRYTTADKLKTNDVYGVTEDGDRNIWLQYSDGVTRIELARTPWAMTHYSKGNGLLSNRTYVIGTSSTGDIWVGTDAGADVYKNGAWRHYGRAEGLVWEDTDTNGFYGDSDGQVWIGTSRGLFHFTPPSHEAPAHPPETRLTSVILGHSESECHLSECGNDSRPLEVKYADRSLQVEFRALTFIHEDDVEFRYRVSGVDDDWIATRERQARYPDLRAGRHCFEVMSRYRGGDWGSPARIFFSVAPPYWETAWFRGLIVLACSFVLVAVWKMRVAHLLRRQRVLEQQVASRTDALRRQTTELELTTAGLQQRTNELQEEVVQRKQAEERAREAQETAEAATKAKGEFLANMSHEIRTPLNGVIGMLELTTYTNLTAEQKDLVRMAQESANSLLVVINDILDFSKIEAGKLELDPIDFDVAETVAEATRTVSVRAHQKKLELIHWIAPEIPQTLVGDSARLKQVLLNLLGNAIKFTSKGEVVLRVFLEKITGDEVSLKFSVSDTGIGIPKEKQKAIFEAFSQADSSTTRKFGGTGLGLTICTLIVKLMGGEIWVESEAGKGATFYFSVTLKRAQSVPAGERKVSHAELAGLPVLIVDDNLTNLHILERCLTVWKMMPTTARSGEEALQILKQAVEKGNRFALLLVDCQMPDMDGFELVQQIKRSPGLSSGAIMMLTSDDYHATSVRCREMGIQKYLIKPVRTMELMNAIGMLVSPEPGEASKTSGTLEVPEKKSDQPVSKLKILLAEDNLVNQKLATRLLQKLGHEVVVVGNGREALDRLEECTYDLVLTDVQMPEMDGFEATAAIREKERKNGGHIPIIAMTAHAMKGDKERCLEAGMDGYVSKPINLTELEQTIDATVGAGRISRSCGAGF